MRRVRWPLPSPRIAGAAVLLVLGFGIAVGVLTGSQTDSTLAAATTPRKVLVVQPPPAVTVTETSTQTRTQTVTTTETQTVTNTETVTEPAEPAKAAPKEEDEKPTFDHVVLAARRGIPLADLVALISGQVPTPEQTAGCAAYTDVAPDGKSGCVFGADIQTLPGQLAAAGRSWRVVVEGLDDPCAHPAAGAPLAPGMERDPVIFFHALVDAPACGSSATPALTLLVPATDAWLKAQLDPLRDADCTVIVPTSDRDPYRLLRTIEDAFALDPLGKAQEAEPIEITTSSR